MQFLTLLQLFPEGIQIPAGTRYDQDCVRTGARLLWDCIPGICCDLDALRNRKRQKPTFSWNSSKGSLNYSPTYLFR